MSKPKAERVNILEDYADTHQELPKKLEENFQRIQELDRRQLGLTQALKEVVDERIREAKAGVPTPTKKGAKPLEPPVPQALLERVVAEVDEVVRCNEQKFELARSSYDLIDDHIRRLDDDLAAFEDEYYAQTSMTTDTAAAIVAGTLPLPSSGWGASAGHHGGGRHGRPAKDSHKRKAAELDVALPAPTEAPTIDPAEPVYCTCKRVSFGNMVSCDAEDCNIEWFHFECVGIPAGTMLGPNDSWYCPECRVRLGMTGTIKDGMSAGATAPACGGAGGAAGAGGDGAALGAAAGGAAEMGAPLSAAVPPPPPRAPRSKSKYGRKH